MIQDYAAVLIQAVIAIGFAVLTLVASVLLGKVGKTNKSKDSAYECGKEAMGPVSPRFSVKFYLVAMIFILFDIEVVFMYPWAVNFLELFKVMRWDIFWAMFLFVLVLEVGHLYAYKKGAFDWNKVG